jgi:hypothetical protein
MLLSKEQVNQIEAIMIDLGKRSDDMCTEQFILEPDMIHIEELIQIVHTLGIALVLNSKESPL